MKFSMKFIFKKFCFFQYKYITLLSLLFFFSPTKIYNDKIKHKLVFRFVCFSSNIEIKSSPVSLLIIFSSLAMFFFQRKKQGMQFFENSLEKILRHFFKGFGCCLRVQLFFLRIERKHDNHQTESSAQAPQKREIYSRYVEKGDRKPMGGRAMKKAFHMNIYMYKWLQYKYCKINSNSYSQNFLQNFGKGVHKRKSGFAFLFYAVGVRNIKKYT